MSAADSSMPGGQPSITQPIAGPCDSPKLVTANKVPKVLPLMPDASWTAPACARASAGGPGLSQSGRTALAYSWGSEACSCSCPTGQSRMYALSIRFSKFWLSTTARATS